MASKTAGGTAIRESVWQFAVIESIHILALVGVSAVGAERFLELADSWYRDHVPVHPAGRETDGPGDADRVRRERHHWECSYRVGRIRSRFYRSIAFWIKLALWSFMPV